MWVELVVDPVSILLSVPILLSASTWKYVNVLTLDVRSVFALDERSYSSSDFIVALGLLFAGFPFAWGPYVERILFQRPHHIVNEYIMFELLARVVVPYYNK